MKSLKTILFSLLILSIVSVLAGNKKSINTSDNNIQSSLVSFQSHLNGEKVDITWETKNQQEVASFIIEKSRDGKEFTTISEVSASVKEMAYVDYFNTDFDVWEGKTYYRITEKDINGNSLKSNIVTVVDNKNRKPTQITERTISLDDMVNLETFEDESLVVVRNRKGEELFSNVQITSQNGDNYIGFDSESYIPEGKYLVIGTNDDRLFGKKLRIRSW